MKKACKANLPALIFLFALLLLWQAGAAEMDAAYILPTPVQILQRLWELREPLFLVHLPATMAVTGIGLAISLVLGLALAVAMDASGLVRRMLYPLVVVSQTIPTTAIAPLFVLWFGYGIWSKVLVTVLITFFPITITVYDGLRAAKVEMIELLRTYGASQWEIFKKIKIPCALPYFFSAVKMAVPMSVIGAAIGEWLGAKSGLGYFSRRMMTQLDGGRGVRPHRPPGRRRHAGGGRGGPAGAKSGSLAWRIITQTSGEATCLIKTQPPARALWAHLWAEKCFLPGACPGRKPDFILFCRLRPAKLCEADCLERNDGT